MIGGFQTRLIVCNLTLLLDNPSDLSQRRLIWYWRDRRRRSPGDRCRWRAGERWPGCARGGDGGGGGPGSRERDSGRECDGRRIGARWGERARGR